MCSCDRKAFSRGVPMSSKPWFLVVFALMIWSVAMLSVGQEKTVIAPLREVSVIVTKEGYYPKNITVFKGERVKFYVTSTVEDPDCMIVQGHKLFLAANKGKLSESEVTFEQEGEFAFYCPSSKHDGKIIVMKKKDATQRNIARVKVVWPKRVVNFLPVAKG